jgi:hypothetical protein
MEDDIEAVEGLKFIENVGVEDDVFTMIVNGGEEFTVHAPDYPRGPAIATIRGKTATLKPGKLVNYAKEIWELAQTAEFPRVNSDRADTFICGPIEPCAAFLRDVDEVRRIYGPNAVSYSQIDAFTEGTFRAKVDVNLDPAPLLSKMIAECYGVDRESPIIIRLTMSDISSYNEMRDTKVECLQSTRASPLAAQLQRIIQFPGRLVKIWETEENSTSKTIKFSATLDEARTKEEEPEKRGGKKKKSVSNDASGEKFDASAEEHRQQQLLENIVSGTDVLVSEDDDPAKGIPARTNGFLVQLMQYAIHRIRTCSTYCVICDLPHIFAGGAMLKPAVCSRELCAFSFHALKVGKDAAEEIATDSGVIDLLICMLKAAAFSTRTDRILQPYPQVVDPTDPKKLALDPKAPDAARLQSILENFPTVRSLSQANDIGDIKRKLDALNPLSFPLMQWTVSSNRSHIVKLRKEDHLQRMKTQHQYMLLTAPPEKQAKFATLKAKHGSKFAFHGSNIENWHCILREGLKNASGTALQLNGTAHGSGIYFACTANTSIGYCRTYELKTGANEKEHKVKDELSGAFINERRMICLALCEIIDKEIKDHGWCWTLEPEDHCMTRFFFVFDPNDSATVQAAGSADTKNETFQQEIKEALSHHNLT